MISVFLSFGMVLEHIWSCEWQGWIFWRKNFCHQNWENWSKTGFFEFIRKFDYSFLLNSRYNENLYYFLFLQKCLFLRYISKCSQPIILQDFLIDHISRTNQWSSWTLHLDANSLLAIRDFYLDLNSRVYNSRSLSWLWFSSH